MLRGRRLRVEIVPGEARYELVDGEPLELRHDDTPFTLERGSPQAHRVARAGGRRAARRSPRIARPAGAGRAGPADRQARC